jgi:hypothetical protein
MNLELGATTDDSRVFLCSAIFRSFPPSVGGISMDKSAPNNPVWVDIILIAP